MEKLTPQTPSEEATRAPFQAIDRPGNTALDSKERQQCERLVKGFQEGLRCRPANVKHDLLTEVLTKLDAGKHFQELWSDHYIREQLLHPISQYNSDTCPSPKVIRAALETLRAQTGDIVDNVAELRRMEPEMRRLANTMDLKTECTMAALQSIQALDGTMTATPYAEELIINRADRNQIAMERGAVELKDDPDWPIISRAYELAERAYEQADELD